MSQFVFRRTQAVDAVLRLLLDCWVPPAEYFSVKVSQQSFDDLHYAISATPPLRAEHAAWDHSAGGATAHQGSMRNTWLAAVRFSATPAGDTRHHSAFYRMTRDACTLPVSSSTSCVTLPVRRFRHSMGSTHRRPSAT
jgi:hypothetical protein